MSIIVPMQGFGGGVPLNFKVVGNPQPTNPKENTIWLNTDVKITGYYFQEKQPENMQHGEVFVSTGSKSNASFNALKKNGITVYPMKAQQMVSGTLKDVEAKIYKGGKWADWWNGELYEKGNDFENITGGWKDYLYFPSYTKGTCTNAEDGFTLTVPGNTYAVARQTVKKIDLTDVKHIELVMEANNSLHKDITITSDNEVTAETRLDNDVASVRLQDVISKDAPITINTEAITGEYYLSIGIYSYNKGAGSVKVISVKTVR